MVVLLEKLPDTAILIRCPRATKIPDSTLKIVDTANPKQPVVINNYTSGYIEDLAINDSLLYLAEGFRGLQILDISHPLSLKPVSACSDVYALGVAVKGGYAFVTDSEGLKVVKIFIPEWLR